MKILYFISQFRDYGQDVLYDGLCQALGPDNVYDYPSLDVLHGGIRNDSMYPCYFDYPVIKSDPEKIEMLRNGEFDAILVGCWPEFILNNGTNEKVKRAYEDIVKILAENNKGTPVFIVDLGDHEGVNTRALRELNAKLYFKSEYCKSVNHDPRVIPLCMAYSTKYMPASIDTQRTNGLFWAGLEHNRRDCPWRTPYLQLLRDAMGMEFRRWKRDRYCQKLLEKTIGLSLRGYGCGTVRYYEVPAHGALLFSDRLNIVIDNDFTDGETAVFFSSPEEMLKKLKYLLENESYVNDIRLRGHEWFKKYHTSKARAEYAIDKIKNVV